MAILLLFIGVAGLYIELHTPGVGIGGVRGRGLLPAVLLEPLPRRHARAGSSRSFLAGVACLLLEMFVIPGFGIFGLGGGAMVICRWSWPAKSWSCRAAPSKWPKCSGRC